MRTLFLLLSVIAMATFPPRADCVMIQSAGVGNSSFTGSLTYTDIDATHATLTIMLTNTTSAAVGNFLTGFLLNDPGNKISGFTMGSPYTNTNFVVLPPPGPYNASPLGDFNMGAALGGDWQGGGNPNNGLAPAGGSGTFTFNLTGTMLDTLTDSSFVNATNTQGNFFAVRFRGGQTSDKEPGVVQPVPEPVSLLLWALCGMGVGGGSVISCRRRTG